MFDAMKLSIARFRRSEDGALIIFGLILFVLLLMMGGLVVDLMRYETTRTTLQNTLDRSTIAAASISQKLDRASVVRDYMTKAGIADELQSVTITAGQNSAIVNAVGVADTHPMFLHMLGIDKFDAVGRSQAEQAISNLDIALVLDVSGSMTGAKIANLKVAAKQFVDTILGNDPNHRVSITIVPYNAQVNIGPDLVSKFNITQANGVDGNGDGITDVNCIEIPTGVTTVPALSQSIAMPMMAYADIAHNTNKTNAFVSPTDVNYAKPNYGSAFCKPTTVNVVRLPNNDPNVLKSQIDALQAGGNTSITIGMKWGSTLIDPSMKGAYNELIAAGKIPASLANRPYAYDDHNALKIIVLMTDGEHVAHDRVTDAYKTGLSGIYKSADGYYSVHFAAGRPAVAGANEYFVPHLGSWAAAPFNGGVQQDWKDVWANLRLDYVAWQFYARALGTDSTTRNAVYSSTVSAMVATYASVPDMDASLDRTCTQVKDRGVVVYGIAVEAPQHGKDVILSCASSPAHFFDASASSIVNAFQTIASNITMLKLTQ